MRVISLYVQAPWINSKGPFTLSIYIRVCLFKNNRSNSDKTQMQRMGSIPILCVNINITIDTKLKFDANAEENVNINVQCERTLNLRFGFDTVNEFLLLDSDQIDQSARV